MYRSPPGAALSALPCCNFTFLLPLYAIRYWRKTMFRKQQASLALFSVFCARTLHADQVKLKNGDTLTGTIVKKDGDKLTLKSEFLGEVTMPWSAVIEARSDNPLYVVLPGGKEVSG